MSVRKKQLLMLAYLFGTAVACADGKGADANIARPIVADAVIQVHNRTPYVVSIYVATDQLVDHLGSVPASAMHSFSIPSAIARSADELFLEARNSEHGITQRSADFQLSRGTRIVWTIDRNGSDTIALY